MGVGVVQRLRVWWNAVEPEPVRKGGYNPAPTVLQVPPSPRPTPARRIALPDAGTVPVLYDFLCDRNDQHAHPVIPGVTVKHVTLERQRHDCPTCACPASSGGRVNKGIDV